MNSTLLLIRAIDECLRGRLLPDTLAERLKDFAIDNQKLALNEEEIQSLAYGLSNSDEEVALYALAVASNITDNSQNEDAREQARKLKAVGGTLRGAIEFLKARYNNILSNIPEQKQNESPLFHDSLLFALPDVEYNEVLWSKFVSNAQDSLIQCITYAADIEQQIRQDEETLSKEHPNDKYIALINRMLELSEHISQIKLPENVKFDPEDDEDSDYETDAEELTKREAQLKHIGELEKQLANLKAPTREELQQLIQGPAKNADGKGKTRKKPKAALQVLSSALNGYLEKVDGLISKIRKYIKRDHELRDDLQDYFSKIEAFRIDVVYKLIYDLNKGMPLEDKNLPECSIIRHPTRVLAIKEKLAETTEPEKKLFLQNGMLKSHYYKWTKLKKVDSDEIPSVTIDGSEFGEPNWILQKLSPEDPRCAFLGKYTSCCQSIGEQGEPCAINGITSPHAGFYVITDKETGLIVAQTWAWRSKDNNLVFDSIESKREFDIHKRVNVANGYCVLAEKLHSVHGIKRVVTGDPGHALQIGVETLYHEELIDDVSYRDSGEKQYDITAEPWSYREGRAILADLQNGKADFLTRLSKMNDKEFEEVANYIIAHNLVSCIEMLNKSKKDLTQDETELYHVIEKERRRRVIKLEDNLFCDLFKLAYDNKLENLDEQKVAVLNRIINQRESNRAKYSNITKHTPHLTDATISMMLLSKSVIVEFGPDVINGSDLGLDGYYCIKDAKQGDYSCISSLMTFKKCTDPHTAGYLVMKGDINKPYEGEAIGGIKVQQLKNKTFHLVTYDQVEDGLTGSFTNALANRLSIEYDLPTTVNVTRLVYQTNKQPSQSYYDYKDTTSKPSHMINHDFKNIKTGNKSLLSTMLNNISNCSLNGLWATCLMNEIIKDKIVSQASGETSVYDILTSNCHNNVKLKRMLEVVDYDDKISLAKAGEISIHVLDNSGKHALQRNLNEIDLEFVLSNNNLDDLAYHVDAEDFILDSSSHFRSLDDDTYNKVNGFYIQNGMLKKVFANEINVIYKQDQNLGLQLLSKFDRIYDNYMYSTYRNDNRIIASFSERIFYSEDLKLKIKPLINDLLIAIHSPDQSGIEIDTVVDIFAKSSSLLVYTDSLDISIKTEFYKKVVDRVAECGHKWKDSDYNDVTTLIPPHFICIIRNAENLELISHIVNSIMLTPDDLTASNLKFLFDETFIRKEIPPEHDEVVRSIVNAEIINDDPELVKRRTRIINKLDDQKLRLAATTNPILFSTENSQSADKKLSPRPGAAANE